MYAITKAAAQPFLMLLVVQSLLLLWLFKRHAASRRLTASLFAVWALMVILSMPVVARVLVGTLERSYPPTDNGAQDVEAIVVLGAGLMPYGPQAHVSGYSYARCLHAADLYRRDPRPLILCGGQTKHGSTLTTEADAMAQVLACLGVNRQDMILENTSLSTRENAAQVIAQIRRQGFDHVLLVTHARHMCRAHLCFRKLGLEVTPSPCGYLSTRLWQTADETLLPEVDWLAKSNAALNEWIAILYYRLRGWI